MSIKISKTLAEHMVAVWKAMNEDSTEQEDQRVYIGRLSNLVTDLGISKTYYSDIFGALYEGEYAVMEDRGGRNKPSTVILLREPTVEELLDLTLTRPGPILSLMKRLDAIEANLGNVSVVTVLQNVERRIQALETQVKNSRTGS